MHEWLLDRQLDLDLGELENRIGIRYLTNPGDEARWRAADATGTETTSAR